MSRLQIIKFVQVFNKFNLCFFQKRYNLIQATFREMLNKSVKAYNMHDFH